MIPLAGRDPPVERGSKSASSTVRICTTAFLLSLAVACTRPSDPVVTVHYLGHAAFLIRFDSGLTVLTDYGESRAYGLDSPVFPLGAARLDVATRSHDHADHAGGELPEEVGSLLANGEGFEGRRLTITTIGTYERTLEVPDNTSYLFEYKGVRVLHLGDCQALMIGLDQLGVRRRVQELYPGPYDLVLVPIGFVSDILSAAADFVTLLDTRRLVPMHYWTPRDRDAFVALMDARSDSRGHPYRVWQQPGARLTLDEAVGELQAVEVIGLTAGPLPN